MRGIRRGVIRSFLQVAAILFCCGAPVFAQTAGTLTLVEGRLGLIRGATQYTATQGVRLGDGDILAVDPKGQAQIEFQDGAILNISQGARVMLMSISPEGGTRRLSEIAVLTGWAKFSAKKSVKGSLYRHLTPLVEMTSSDAIAVLNTSNDFTEIFIESGTARLSESGRKSAQRAARDAKGGEFIVRRGAQAASFAPRPSADFIKSMPLHFKDDLPVFLDRFKGRKAEPKSEHDVTYAEVEAWLKAGPSVRRNFVKRFEGRAKDPEFRRKLVDNLQEHPEWDKVLFPEKYEPKDPNDPKSGQPNTKQ